MPLKGNKLTKNKSEETYQKTCLKCLEPRYTPKFRLSLTLHFKFQRFSYARNFTPLFTEKNRLALYFCNPRKDCSDEKYNEFPFVGQVSLAVLPKPINA